MTRAFSRKRPARKTEKWWKSEAGRFHLAYSVARETLDINQSIDAAALALGVSRGRAYELWRDGK